MVADTRTIAPQPGPQLEAFRSKADILIYGGQAGGGKSWYLLNEPLRRIHNKGFRGVIFRRTFAQVTQSGGLWDQCQDIYRACGAHMRSGDCLDATFQSGANISFAHMQHEKTKYEYMGAELCYIGFDELTHFSESQFFYMLSRNRSTCGIRPYIRATCNPAPGWVADLISWWIDPITGLVDPSKSGKIRYFVRTDDESLDWADTKEELRDRYPYLDPSDILSLTFIAATLEDNPALLEKDPGYKAKLMLLPRIERERLLGGNWKVAEGAQLSEDWFKTYHVNGDNYEFLFQSRFYSLPTSVTRRIATIDTAGTSKEKAAAKRGVQPSWSVCGIWDSVPRWTIAQDGKQLTLTEFLFLRYVWRKQVNWDGLKAGINETLETWNVTKAYVENAHHGQALVREIRVCPTELIGPVIPGMGDRGEDAKLERAIASGMLARFEHGKVFVPPIEEGLWVMDYLRELRAWTGAPGEVADQIDMTSYASFISKTTAGKWGGVIPQKGVR